MDSVSHARLLLFVAVAACIGTAQAAPSIIPDQDYGYVDVRDGAHMFWWLSPHVDASKRDQVPLIMWLQGGPGGSSTGFGNFMELGPLDVNLKPRNTTWVQAANILFVDNPVGTGYSYVDDKKYLTHDVKEIADDLVTLFAAFLKRLRMFEEIPFYVFCESYGGKMTAAFGTALLQAIKDKKLTAKFKGVALGDGWVSPIDSVKTWGPYLYGLSLIDDKGLEDLKTLSDKIEQALEDGNGASATAMWNDMEVVVENLTDGVNFYNVLNYNSSEEQHHSNIKGLPRHLSNLHAPSLADLMNGQIKKELHIPDKVVWGAQAGAVFAAQAEDFMKNVISDVDTLLDAGVKVVVYTGQLDLIVDTMGTLQWIDKLKWSKLQDFQKSRRSPLYPPSGKKTHDTGAFVQTYDNFSVYWILKAGHMVPHDAGEMALEMVKLIISD